MENYCLHYRLHVAIFSRKFQIPTTFSFVVFQSTNLLFSFKKTIYFKGKAISVSFLTSGNDILIILRCVFRYLFSYLTGKLCFKNWEKPNGKVLKSKLSFKNIAIFAVEYLNKKNSWYVKFSNVILFLLSLETWKHLKRVKDHPSVIFQNAWLYL